ncbi:hypothetical protein ACOMHN_030387 [Nucella lapillus]
MTVLDRGQFQLFISILQAKETKIRAEYYHRKNKILEKRTATGHGQPKKSRVPRGPRNTGKIANRHFRRKNPVKDCSEPAQVINLFTVELSKEQEQLLSRGPKFCPTPASYNEWQLLDDSFEGLRRVRLKEYWYDEEVPVLIPTRPKFYKKNYWEPPKGRDDSLDAFCSTVVSRVTAHAPRLPKQRNISRKSQEALQQLRDLVQKRILRISPADKGEAVVVQSFSQYHEEAMRQLCNTEPYRTSQEDTSQDIAKQSNECVHNLHGQEIIDDKCREWAKIKENDVKTPTFYHLPKVHKDNQNPPGRLIVLGIGGPTERLSKLVDHWLQPVVHKLPSFIKDTTHLFQLIHEWNDTNAPWSEEILIVTIDVVALYPSIPQEEVPVALRDMLANEDPCSPIPPIGTLLPIVDHVLQNNIFEFDGQLFQQIQGTAMGTPMAPAIANLYMGWVEKRLLSKTPWLVDPESWRRFIDDIIMLWTHGEKKLLEFLNWLNEQHQQIKFTWNYGQKQIPFLDVSISLVEGRLETDLHVKPTDVNMLLPFKSCHPRHCRRGIPFGQCIRIHRICSREDTFHLRCAQLRERLLNRGYPERLIQGAISRVKKMTRQNTLNYARKTKCDRVPFVITHNPTHPPLGKWLKELMPTLHQSRRMRKAMPNPRIVGERICHNLRRLLMQSRLPPHNPPSPPPDSDQPGRYKCTSKRCVVCQLYLLQTTTFSSVRTGQTFSIRDRVSCKTNNLIYLMDCAKCKDVQYTGETGQTLQRRFHAHRSNIGVNTEKQKSPKELSKYRQDTLVAKHFQRKGHSVLDMRVTVIETMRSEEVTHRRARERFWRHKLKTNYPDGLNVWD